MMGRQMRGPGWGLRANTGAGLRGPTGVGFVWGMADVCGARRILGTAPWVGPLQMCAPPSCPAPRSSTGRSSVLSENGKWLREVWECGDLPLPSQQSGRQEEEWPPSNVTPSRDTRSPTLLSRIHVTGRSLVGAMGCPGPAAGQPTHLP